MTKLTTFASLILFCCGFSATLVAEPPEGRGWKKKHKHSVSTREEKYWDGNCEVKREWKSNGDYEEKRKCRGGRQAPVQVVVLPPWFDRHGPEPEYRPEWQPAPRPSATRCNSDKVASVLGGLIGGVLGHQVGDGRGKTAATIGGAIAGVLIGGEIGRRMDARNQACVAQALEFAPEGERITWDDTQGGAQYVVTPGAVEQRGDHYCRSFTAEVSSRGESQSTRGSACRRADGTWVQSL
ncbi:RT0821/Lpp0805 family surface protein [Microbulbifer sp. 2201CG32-9]|uniref:RT0821/Lpp0805 family surface protein n=1 Tax=Microbulbifer sp. 2201CG32-9 TaxID=3232309 RepID=UPI00345BE746